MKIEITSLAENGLGFGEGAISVRDRLGSPDDGLSGDILDNVQKAIRDSNIFAPIGTDDEGKTVKDDGCPDGRGVIAVFDKSGEYSESLLRPKVFGGGAAMAFAALVGNGKSEDGPTETFDAAAAFLDERSIDYGAHCDEHASGNASGCGAIDKAEDIITNVCKYDKEIAGTIDSIARSLGYESGELDKKTTTVMGNFRAYKDNCHGGSNGQDRLECVAGRDKIIKRLGGGHKEVRVVLNTAEKYTFDQQYIRELSHGEAQIFAVDIWRMQEIAAGMYPEDEESKELAFLSMLAYSLGTSATLTKGDLPVDLAKAG